MRFARLKIITDAGAWLGLSWLAVVAITRGWWLPAAIELVGALVFACWFVIDWSKYREHRKALTDVPPTDEG